MADRTFVSEPITPDRGTFECASMARALVGVPSGFRWGERSLEIEDVLHHEKVSVSWDHASGDRYLRRELFTMRFRDGSIGEVYFVRNPTSGTRRSSPRWFLYTITEPAGTEEG